MRLWADVLDTNNRKVGDGPITSLLSASVTRALDGAGSISVDVPLTDERARTLLTNEARLRIYLEEDNVQRELGRGTVRNVKLSGNASSYRLSADGPDALDELKRYNTLLGRAYAGQSVEDIAAALVGLVPGWTVSADAGGNLYSARLDGVSVLKALLTMVEQQGVHLRPGTAPNTLEIGAFGDFSDLVLINPTMAPAGLYANNDVALIENISLTQNSEAVANWLLPIGGGEGTAALTLEHSTRSWPYVIQTMAGPDGRTLYYLTDDASVALYGTIQKVGTFKNISPVTNSAADVVNAANALYDAATAWLQRNSVVQDSYAVTLKKTRQNLRPGDTVRLLYGGVVLRDGEPYTWLEVDELFWVLKVTERVTASGLSTSLEISTVDRHREDAASIILGALESIELRNIYVQPYPTSRGYVYEKNIDSTHNVEIPVKVTDVTLDIIRVQLTLNTSPLRSTATGAASGGGSTATSAAGGGATSSAGGDHRHRMFQFNSTTDLGNPNREGFCKRSDGNNVNFAWHGSAEDLYTFDASGDHTHTVPSHTHSVTIPAHTHAQQYGIYDDTTYPQNLSIWINGIDRTSELGGPWAPSNAAAEVELDITTYLRDAVGGLRQKHTIEVRCTAGQGTIQAIFDVYEIIQAVQVS